MGHVLSHPKFLLTRLMRGATRMAFQIQKMYEISTHAPHARRDNVGALIPFYFDDFYSRASCEARPSKIRPQRPLPRISTHAPHARRDLFGLADAPDKFHFYSRASCEARL